MLGAFIVFIIVVAIVVLAGFGGRCPKCKEELDYNQHGYQQKYGHCHRCGYCTFCGDGGTL